MSDLVHLSSLERIRIAKLISKVIFDLSFDFSNLEEMLKVYPDSEFTLKNLNFAKERIDFYKLLLDKICPDSSCLYYG